MNHVRYSVTLCDELQLVKHVVLPLLERRILEWQQNEIHGVYFYINFSVYYSRVFIMAFATKT